MTPTPTATAAAPYRPDLAGWTADGHTVHLVVEEQNHYLLMGPCPHADTDLTAAAHTDLPRCRRPADAYGPPRPVCALTEQAENITPEEALSLGLDTYRPAAAAFPVAYRWDRDDDCWLLRPTGSDTGTP